MLDSKEKQNILQNFKNKEDKIFVSNILDKAFRFERTNKIEYTNFLNMNEYNISKNILNSLKVKYYTYRFCEDSSRFVIFFIPDYITSFEEKYLKNYITILKITPKNQDKITHRDYMGSIYSLGIKNDMIGDIFLQENFAYVNVIKPIDSYIINNLFKVKNQEVIISTLDFSEIDISKVFTKFIEKGYIVPSMRCDCIVSQVFKLNRNDAKKEIVGGNLYLNDKCIITPDMKLKNDDIVSLRHYGKFRFLRVISETRSGNYKIDVKIYN